MSLHFVFHQAAIFLINNNYWARYENTRGSYKCICQGFEGNAAEKTVGCVRKPVSCKAQPDCPPNTFCYGGICKPVCENSNRCTEGRCIPLCTIDSQCVFNKKCVFSNCMLTCRVDNDCFFSHICLNNMCTIGCQQNSDCTTDESCINSRFKNPCLFAVINLLLDSY